MDERVLAFRYGMQADLDAGVFRSLRERDGLAAQPFSLAVVDHGRRETGQIVVEHVYPGIVPPHTGAADPRLAEEFQRRPVEELVGAGVGFQGHIFHLHVEPGRDRQDGTRQWDALVTESHRHAHGRIAAYRATTADNAL